jgi:anti-sigma B factor antagonist
MSSLSLTVERRRGLRVVDARGELDLDSAPTLCAALRDGARRCDGEHVIADLTNVGFCDSTGLKALLDAAREVEIAGGRLIAVVPEDGPVRRTLALTGAEEFLGVTPDRAQVLAALSR